MLLNYWSLVLMLFLARFGWAIWTYTSVKSCKPPRVTWSEFIAALIVSFIGILLFAIPVHHAILLIDGWVNQ